MKIRYGSYLFILFVLILSACIQPITAPEDGPGDVPEEAPADATGTLEAEAGAAYTGPGEEVVTLAAEMVSQELGVDLEQVEVKSVEAVEWPDACLGAAASDELCAQVITPGYRVVLSVEGTEHVFHTNEDGSSIRPATDS